MTEKLPPIEIPTHVLDGLEFIRKSGLTNMLARDVVIDLARQFDLNDTADWIEENKNLYAEGIFRGFKEVD